MRVRTIATLGPASMEYEIMKSMVLHGVRIFRLNFSHADAASFAPAIANIRKIEEELGIPITAMGDLCGPKVRIGEVFGSPVTIQRGCTITLGLPEMAAQGQGHCAFISLDIPELLVGLLPDMPVSLSDGMLQFVITKTLVKDKLYVMQAQNDGMLTSHKGIAFPGKFHPMPAMTPKDRKDLREGLDAGLDAVALSFVQNHSDIDDIHAEMDRIGRRIPVVAKLERKNALDDLTAILQRVDAVMIARGDLGLECPMSELPVIQKRVIRAARHAQKACIVATQMLLSMVQNPIPTRAEATDVANAMLDGADCVMLSEETAIGKHPERVVRFIEDIATSAEAYYLERLQGPFAPKREKNLQKYIAYAATLVADNADSKAVICHTLRGDTARLMSSRRPAQPIFALCPDPAIQRGLNFFWGVHPRMPDLSIARHMARLERFVQRHDFFESGDTAVLTSSQPTPGQKNAGTNAIKLYTK